MNLEDSRIEQARTEHEILMEDPSQARKKKRADRRRRRKYKFSDKHHAKRGIVSAILAIPGIILLTLAVSISVSEKGQGGEVVGFLAFFSLLLAIVGIILASTTFRKPDTIYTWSWVGLVLHILVFLFVAFMLVIGL